MAKTTKAAPAPTTRRKVLGHDDKSNFWKPSHIGDKIMGKLIAVTSGKNGPVAQIRDFSGAVRQVGLNDQLQKAPWDDMKGMEVEIIFQREVATKYGNKARLFDVYVSGEDAAF